MYSIDLEKCDPRRNMYRFYRMYILPNLFGEWTLAREWGRIGTRGRSQIDWFETEKEAQCAMLSLKTLKSRRGYFAKPEQLSLF